MAQVRRGFERTIISRIIVLCDFDRIFRVSIRLQPVERCVIAMQQDKAAVVSLLNQDLTEGKRHTKAIQNFRYQTPHL